MAFMVIGILETMSPHNLTKPRVLEDAPRCPVQDDVTGDFPLKVAVGRATRVFLQLVGLLN